MSGGFSFPGGFSLAGGGGAPTGAAGGDLGGTYPNPLVLKTNGVAFGTAAIVNTGTSGATIPLNNGANVFSVATINLVTITAPATGSTLTIADGKTFTVSNTLTLAGTDGSTLNVGAGGTLGTAAFKNTGTSGATIPLLNTNVTFSAGTNAVTINNGGTTGLLVTGGTNGAGINLDYSSSGVIQVRATFTISNAATTAGGFFEADVSKIYVGAAGFGTVSSWGVPASGTWRSGDVDAAAPVAQSLIVQSVVAGTSNTAGALWKFVDSAGTGTGASGGFEWDTHPLGGSGTAQNAAVSKMTLSSAGTLNVSGGITSSSSVTAGGALTAGSTQFINWTSRGILTSPAAGTIQHGNTDAAAPVAQTLTFQNVVAGTADTAGANATLTGSLSTGSGVSGDIILRTGGTGAGSTVQNSAVTALTIKGATQAVIIASGKTFQIGNAATTGLTPGVLAATTNATIVITDSGGQAYRIPCII